MTVFFDRFPSTLWTLSRPDSPKLAWCDVRFVPHGVAIEMLRDGRLLWSRVFATGDEARVEAEREKERMMREGWEMAE